MSRDAHTELTQNRHDVLSLANLLLQSLVATLECSTLLVVDAHGVLMHRVDDLSQLLKVFVGQRLGYSPPQRRRNQRLDVSEEL